MIEKTITAPAVINLTGIINEVKTDIEARRKKQLAELRREHRGWQARSFSISPQACDAFEEIVFQKWRTGEAAPDSILSACISPSYPSSVRAVPFRLPVCTIPGIQLNV